MATVFFFLLLRRCHYQMPVRMSHLVYSQALSCDCYSQCRAVIAIPMENAAEGTAQGCLAVLHAGIFQERFWWQNFLVKLEAMALNAKLETPHSSQCLWTGASWCHLSQIPAHHNLQQVEEFRVSLKWHETL